MNTTQATEPWRPFPGETGAEYMARQDAQDLAGRLACPCCGGTAFSFSGIVPKCLACGAGADIEGCCGE